MCEGLCDSSPSLVVERGAIFDGSCRMGAVDWVEEDGEEATGNAGVDAASAEDGRENLVGSFGGFIYDLVGICGECPFGGVHGGLEVDAKVAERGYSFQRVFCR